MSEDKSKHKTKKSCRNSELVWSFFCLFVLLLIYSSICVIIYKYIHQDDIIITSIFLVVFYLIYIILELFSPTSRFLCNKKSDKIIYEKLRTYFSTPPEIIFECQCYHYPNNNNSDNKWKRIITFNDTYKFPYYSERDVSGLLYLDSNQAKLEKKKYIKLELIEEILFADSVSYLDYENEKDLFWRRNRFRDSFFDFHEIKTIPKM